jgi:hypothetical protein
MNRDQAKSKTFSEKKRGEVEDGTADRMRMKKAREEGLESEKLVEFQPIHYPAAMEIGSLLNLIAELT